VGQLVCGILASGELGTIVKPDGSPVTRADKLAERVLREAIARDFPHDSILGEEEGLTQGTSGFRWVIDPIDGTKSYIAGIPTFGNLIGVQWLGNDAHSPASSIEGNDQTPPIVAGYAGFPLVREELWALAGEPAWWRTESLGGTFVREARMTTKPTLATATIDTGSPQTFARGGRDAVFARLSQRTQRCRSWSDAYSFALAATGRIDAAVGFKANLWDLAPFAIICAQAGGSMTNWAGEAKLESGTYLACGQTLRAELSGVLCEGEATAHE
jgi:histidinol phosphatase-like enzyme (inositol monophosphatase family)